MCVVLMILRPPISTRTYTLFPHTPLFRSRLGGFGLGGQVLHLRRLALAVPGDAVRKIVHHVQARDVLLVEVVDRVRILLAEDRHQHVGRSEEHTSEIQSLMRNSYAVFCLKQKRYSI